MQFFIPVPVPKVWEWVEPFPLPFPNVQKSFPLTPAILYNIIILQEGGDQKSAIDIFVYDEHIL